jgi:hypothetical protein
MDQCSFRHYSAKSLNFFVSAPQPREYTSPPPDVAQWNGAEGGDQPGVAVATKIAEGTRVQCLFKDTENPSDVGEWYDGTAISQNEDGFWKIKFDDGDEDNFKADDPDLRLASGPWAAWLILHFRPVALGVPSGTQESISSRDEVFGYAAES